MEKKTVLKKLAIKSGEYSDLSQKAENQIILLLNEMKVVNNKLIEEESISISYVAVNRIIKDLNYEDLYNITTIGMLYTKVTGSKKLFPIERKLLNLKNTLEKATQVRNRMMELVEDFSYDPEFDELLDIIDSLRLNESISVKILENKISEIA